MSHKATNWAVAQRGIRPAAKVLLWQLADRHNPDNGCFPDQETLARDCEMSLATVNRQLADLEAAGLIKRIQWKHKITKKQMTTRYRLAFEDDFLDSDSLGAGERDASGGQESRLSNCESAFPGASVDAVGGDHTICATASDADDVENHASARPASRLSNGEIGTEKGESRLSNLGVADSHLERKPTLTGESRIRRLTSNLTSNITSKRAGRAERESVFKEIWKAFPLRPGSSSGHQPRSAC